MDPVPGVVTLHVWGVTTPAVPLAVARMAIDRPLLARTPATFWKLLGTGSGRTFTLKDADPRHWGVLAAWPAAEDAKGFEASPTVRGWDRIAHERLVVRMRPLVSRGLWSRRAPFGEPAGTPTAGPVASITRARLRARDLPAFWRAVPDVSADLREAPGLRFAVGIGEAPVGLQATFSIWDDARALKDFAYRREPHRRAISSAHRGHWFAEELFARFEVLEVEGTLAGRAV